MSLNIDESDVQCPICYETYDDNHIPVCLASGVLVCSACSYVVVHKLGYCPFTKMNLNGIDSVDPQPCLFAIRQMNLNVSNLHQRALQLRPLDAADRARVSQSPHLKVCCALDIVERSQRTARVKAHMALHVLLWESADAGIRALHAEQDAECMTLRAVCARYVMIRSWWGDPDWMPGACTAYMFLHLLDLHNVFPKVSQLADGSEQRQATPRRRDLFMNATAVSRALHNAVSLMMWIAIGYICFFAEPMSSCDFQTGTWVIDAMITFIKWALRLAAHGCITRAREYRGGFQHRNRQEDKTFWSLNAVNALAALIISADTWASCFYAPCPAQSMYIWTRLWNNKITITHNIIYIPQEDNILILVVNIFFRTRPTTINRTKKIPIR